MNCRIVKGSIDTTGVVASVTRGNLRVLGGSVDTTDVVGTANNAGSAVARDMTIAARLEKLKGRLKAAGGCMVAFSGGVDSSFLLYVAHLVLGERAIGVTVSTCYMSPREMTEAEAFVRRYGMRHLQLTLPLSETIRHNPADKCYHCKKRIFSSILQEAEKRRVPLVFDGTNSDDAFDYRPGMKALRELGIVSPLQETGFTKNEIRKAAHRLGLPVWDKPAFACLLSRIPVGEEVTEEKLRQIDQAEQILFDAGFRAFRVRHHGDIARLEVDREERAKICDVDLADDISKKIKKLGFRYVAFELEGYRMGSMNAMSPENKVLSHDENG